MEDFLLNLNLLGPIEEYLESLAGAGYYGPEDFLDKDLTTLQLEYLGISSRLDCQTIYSTICAMRTENLNSEIDFSLPDFDIDPDGVDDEYDNLKRQYEQMLSGGLENEPILPEETTPEEEDYEAMKAKYNELMSQADLASVTPTNDAETFDDEYDRLKAQYNNLLQQEQADMEQQEVQEELPELDEYERAKAEYNNLLQQEQLDVEQPEVQEVPELDEYERAKAEYEKMLLSAVEEQPTGSVSPEIQISPRSHHEASRRIQAPPRPHDPIKPSQTSPRSLNHTRANPSSPRFQGSLSPPEQDSSESLERSPLRRNARTAAPNGVNNSLARPPVRPAEGERPKELPKSFTSPLLPSAISRPNPISHSVTTSEPEPLQNAVPIQGASIVGVKLTKDPAAQAQLQALKALAAQGNFTSFGDELDIEVLEPIVSGGDLLFSVRLTTNMRQFSHLTFHRLDTTRRYIDFEDLHKKITQIGNYASTFPKFPRKKEKSNSMVFNQMMQFVARDPGLHQLAFVVDFFDNHKCGPSASVAKAPVPRSASFFKKK